MPGEEQARGAGGLRGKAEATCGEGCPDTGSGEGGEERAAFQSLLEGPCGVIFRPCLDDEQARGV